MWVWCACGVRRDRGGFHFYRGHETKILTVSLTVSAHAVIFPHVTASPMAAALVPALSTAAVATGL